MGDHLVGSPLLRAHLHGYFMDIRLYRKAASAKPANALENIKKDMVRKQIKAQREGRVKIETKMPKVNKDLFVKLKVDEDKDKRKEFDRKYGVKESDDEDRNSGDSDIEMDDSEKESSDDDQEWTKEVKK